MIINALIIGATLILAPMLITETLTVDYLPMYLQPGFIFGVLVAVALSFFFVKEKLSVCPLLGGAVAGTLNFLPLPLNAGHVACIMLIIYYITGYIIIRQKRMKLGPPQFLWPILLVTLIIFYHNHSLNVGILGGSEEGARPAILIYLVTIAYFCAINLVSPSVSFLRNIPFLYFVVTVFSSIPYLLSTYIPGLAPLLYNVTNSVNVDVYVDSLNGTGESDSLVGKLAAFGPIGSSLQLYLLCYYPIGTWLRPDRWWVAGLSIVCIILQVACGYRGEIFSFALLVLAGAWAYYSWRSLILPMVVAVAALVLFVASSNNIVHLPVNKLPLIAQRTLSFLPGDWDKEAKESGESSNDFRKGIQDVYIDEYMKRSPLIGNGFTIDTKEFQFYQDAMRSGGWGDRSYLQAKTFIEGKLFHTGWISVYDCVGIIGTLSFVLLGWNEIRMVRNFMGGPRADRQSTLFPLYVWIFCQLVAMMGSFFAVFGSFPDAFTGLLIYGMILSHLRDIENNTEIPVALTERTKQPTLHHLEGVRYGYPS